MSASMIHTPGPYIVRGEVEAGSPGYAMGVEPATDDAGAPRECGWPYFIREDRDFPLGSGPLWLAHGIQRKADADLFATAPDMLAALRAILPYAESRLEDMREACDAARGTASWDEANDLMMKAAGAFASARAAIAKAEGRR